MCDSFAVDATASSDGASRGTVWFGKNSDREPAEAQVVEHVPARKSRGRLALTHVEIDDADAAEVVISRPTWMWGAEMGVNVHGVAVCNEALLVKGDLPPRGITGMDIVRLALERGHSAKSAVDIIIDLVRTHGQGGRMFYGTTDSVARRRYSSAFLVVDATDMWVVETADRVAVAKRYVGVVALSNMPIIRTHMDITDESAIESVRNDGRLIGGAFDFEGSYGLPALTALTGATQRRSMLTTLLTQAPTDLQQAMAVLRTHGGDRSASPWRMNGMCSHAGPWPTMMTAQTTASMIVRLRPNAPPRVWATGTSSPCLSVFKPISMGGVGPGFVQTKPSTERVDDESLFWRHERLHRRIVCGGNEALIEADRLALQERALSIAEGAVDDENALWEEHRRVLPSWLARVEPQRRRLLSITDHHWRSQSKRVGLPW
jgi:secernin